MRILSSSLVQVPLAKWLQLMSSNQRVWHLISDFPFRSLLILFQEFCPNLSTYSSNYESSKDDHIMQYLGWRLRLELALLLLPPIRLLLVSVPHSLVGSTASVPFSMSSSSELHSSVTVPWEVAEQPRLSFSATLLLVAGVRLI